MDGETFHICEYLPLIVRGAFHICEWLHFSSFDAFIIYEKPPLVLGGQLWFNNDNLTQSLKLWVRCESLITSN